MTTVTLSPAQSKALLLKAADPKEWLDNFIAANVHGLFGEAQRDPSWTELNAQASGAGINMAEEAAVLAFGIDHGLLETAAAKAARLEEEARQRAEEIAAQHPMPETGLSFLQFMDLFTEAEQLALAEAAMSDPAVKLWYDRALGAAYVRLDDSRTIAGLEVMVGLGLLAQARAAQVLEGERPAPAM